MKRALLILALVAVVAVPFVLRPKKVSVANADETVVIVTPHNEAIRYEYSRGFAEWYKVKTGRTVAIDWRVLGGTSEIARFLESEYITAFQNYWTNELKKPWSTEVQSGSQNGRLPADAPAIVKEARAIFLSSDVGSGIDVFFGGGTYDFAKQATAGRFVKSDLPTKHPEWFSDDVIPLQYAGEEYRDKNGLWCGCVLSSYGIIYNRDALQRLGLTEPPKQWSDLGLPKYFGEVALCDPTKSGSIAKAFENVIQQQMQRRVRSAATGSVGGDAREQEKLAVREGWIDGLRILQLIGANARYFTDTSQKPPIDVAAGNCAVGMCIDFYGRTEVEVGQHRDGTSRLGYVSPVGGSVSSVDPIGLLRGAKHKEVANAFIEYVLSMEGQKLWNFKPGTNGGPERYALRRLPVRRDFYAQAGLNILRSDPDALPYSEQDQLIYHDAWTAGIFREMAFIIRVMCQDTHDELVAAWRAINEPTVTAENRSAALAVLQDLSVVSYERTSTDIKRALSSKNKVEEIQMANAMARTFRQQYQKAIEVAAGGPH